jgi:hypothetical protein
MFVSVTDCAAEVVATRCDPKARLVGLSDTAGAGCVPVPVRPRACGLSAASSVIDTLAPRLPVALGLNVTLRVQVAPAASVSGASGQSLLWAKSAAFVPETPIPVIVSGAEPEFLSVDVCEPLVVPISCPPKARLVGVSVTAGAWPEPLSAMFCGLPDASSVTATLAARLPPAPGVNVAEIVQDPPAASVEGAIGQSFDCAKSAALAPVTAMLLMVSAALPVFVSVEVCAALVEPIGRAPKSRLEGLRLTPGAAAAPVPLRPRLCGLPVASSAIETDADREPDAPGVNVTEIVHVALTASVAGLSGQLLSCAKSAALAPDITMLLIVSGAVPEFRSVEL